MSFLSEHLKVINRAIVIIVLLLAAFVRFYHYDAWSLSNDELSAIIRLQFDCFDDLIQFGVKPDFHPSGVQVFLFYYAKLFGDSATAVRIPFVISGILSVVLLFFLARRWFGETSALFASSALAFLEFPLLFSQIARPYSFGLMLILLAAILVDRVVFNEKKNNLWFYTFLLAVTWALLMYNHYYSFLTAGFLGLGVLFYTPKNRIKYLVSSAVVAVILFIPHVNVTIYHLSKGGVESWLAKPDNDWLFLHILYVFNNSLWLLFGVMAAVVCMVFKEKKKLSKYFVISLIVFFGALFTGFLYSKYVSAIIQHSTMLFVLPFLLMVVFSRFRESVVNTVLLIVFIGALLVSLFGVDNFYKKQHFGEFKEVAEIIEHWNSNYNGKILNICSANDVDYLNYYFVDDSADFAMSQLDTKSQLDSLAEIVNASGKQYLSFAITKPCSSKAIDIMAARYPYKYFSKNYSGLAQVFIFGKECDGRKEFSAFADESGREVSSFVLASENKEVEDVFSL
ncbi:MAG: glycosyltransferase family 39 protein, partial [Bacteroidota bacterium]|nr:glycosyltransferase family 39 protein [Bacteroidota bacterium]